MNWCLRALDSADLRGDRLLGRGRGVEPIRRAPAQTTWRGSSATRPGFRIKHLPAAPAAARSSPARSFRLGDGDARVVEVGPNLVDDIVISRCLRRQHQPEWQHPNPEERENAEEGSGNEQHARHQPDPPERRPAQPKDYSLHTARPPVDHPPEQPLATLRRGLARRGSGIGGLGAVQSLAENKKRLRQFKQRLHPGGLAPLLR